MPSELSKIMDFLRANFLLALFKWIFRKNFVYSSRVLIGGGVYFRVGGGGRVVLGRRVVIRPNCYISSSVGGEMVFGDEVFINCGCVITVRESINIGSGVTIGPNVVIVDHDHDVRALGHLPALDAKFVSKPVIIEDGAWIGANVVILKGARIGKGSVIAAGSVVRGSVPEGVVFYSPREYISNRISRG